ncbi:MAG: glycosyltransferase family 25 protein, partial [Sphingobacteriales bacterium]
VVNLRRSIARRIYIQEKLLHYNIPFEMFEAVDGNELCETELNEIYAKGSYFKTRYGRVMNIGEIGCALSHIGLYKKILEEKIPYAIILEDDIEFDERLSHIVQNNHSVEKLLNHFDLVLLGYADTDLNYRKPGICSVWKRIKLDHIIKAGVPVSRCWGTIGYLISLKGAEKLLSRGSIPLMQADFLTSNSPEMGVRFGIIRNQIVWPHEIGEESIIGKRFFDETASIGTAIRSVEQSRIKKGLLYLNKLIPLKRGYYFVKNILDGLSKKRASIWAKLNPKQYGYVEKIPD